MRANCIHKEKLIEERKEKKAKKKKSYFFYNLFGLIIIIYISSLVGIGSFARDNNLFFSYFLATASMGFLLVMFMCTMRVLIDSEEKEEGDKEKVKHDGRRKNRSK